MEIVKVYREHYPALRLIGKRYINNDKVSGGFGAKWDEWFKNDWFSPLERLGPIPESEKAYLGVMRWANAFEYWIGMFFPAGTPVPGGYGSADIAEGDVAICWAYGKGSSGEFYGSDIYHRCMGQITRRGWEPQEYHWFFEKFNCPRFTTPDEKGNVILDYCIYIE